MVLILLIFLTSSACFLLSFITSVLVILSLYARKEVRKSTNPREAVLISGCDSGIGLELAKYLYETFEFTIICGFLEPNSSNGYKLLSKLVQADGADRLILEKLDVTCEEDIKLIVTRIEELREDGKIRSLVALVNNAGVMTYGEFDWLTRSQIKKQIDVNLTGTMMFTLAMLPHIIEAKGRIINVSSVNDTTIFPGLSVYSATKSGLSTFSKALGYEMRKLGVHVVTIRLGDFARLTNIMARHSAHRDAMWNNMSTKKKDMYRDYFHEFNRHLMDNYGMTSPKDFENSPLFEDFSRALLLKNPPNTVVCAPLSFRVFYFLIELTPVWIQYYLLDILIQIGFRWKPPQVRLNVPLSEPSATLVTEEVCECD